MKLLCSTVELWGLKLHKKKTRKLRNGNEKELSTAEKKDTMRKNLDAVAIKCEKGVRKMVLCWETKIGLNTYSKLRQKCLREMLAREILFHIAQNLIFLTFHRIIDCTIEHWESNYWQFEFYLKNLKIIMTSSASVLTSWQ